MNFHEFSKSISHSSANTLKRRGGEVLSGLVATALVTRGIGTLPLSHDEFYTLNAVNNGPLSHLWEAPLVPYYTALWLWTGGGSLVTDEWLRFLSAVAVVVTVILVAATARLVSGARAAMASGLLLAITPAVQVFGQMARPYALGTLFFAVATFFVVKAATLKQGKFWWAYGLALLAGTIVMPQGSAILVAHLVYLKVIGAPRKVIVSWVKGVLVLVPFMLVGFLLLILGTYRGMHEWLHHPGLLDLPRGILWLASADAPSITAAGAIGGALLALGLLTVNSRALALGAGAGLLVVWAVSLGPTSFWFGQSFFPFVPMLALSAGLALSTYGSRVVVLVIVTLTLVSIPAFTEIRLPRENEPDMRRAAEIYVENLQPGQAVFVFGVDDAYGLWPAVRHYFPDVPTPRLTSQPSIPYWAAEAKIECSPIQEWDIGAQTQVRLCAPKGLEESGID